MKRPLGKNGGFKIIYTNAECLKNKKDEIFVLAESKGADVICLSFVNKVQFLE